MRDPPPLPRFCAFLADFFKSVLPVLTTCYVWRDLGRSILFRRGLILLHSSMIETEPLTDWRLTGLAHNNTAGQHIITTSQCSPTSNTSLPSSRAEAEMTGRQGEGGRCWCWFRLIFSSDRCCWADQPGPGAGPDPATSSLILGLRWREGGEGREGREGRVHTLYITIHHTSDIRYLYKRSLTSEEWTGLRNNFCVTLMLIFQVIKIRFIRDIKQDLGSVERPQSSPHFRQSWSSFSQLEGMLSQLCRCLFWSRCSLCMYVILR